MPLSVEGALYKKAGMLLLWKSPHYAKRELGVKKELRRV
jgi:hypothetical protein